MTDGNDKHYFKKLDKTDRQKILEKLGSKPIEINLWLKSDPGHIEEFETTGILSDNRITMEAIGSLLTKLKKSSLINKTVLLKFTIGDYRYFSTGNLSSGASGAYYLLIGPDVFKHEQRKDFRIEASRTHDIKFKVDDEVFEGIDVSAGGVSFKSKIKHADRFPKDEKFLDCKLKINQFQCEVKAVKVVKTFETSYTDEEDGKKYKYLTVCMQFHGISPQEEAALSQYVLNEARGVMLAKKLLGQ